MATDMLYNSIILHSIHTRQFHQEPVLDQSGTDQIGQKFTIHVEGIMHLQSAVGSIGGNNPTPNVGPAGYSMGAGSISDLYAIVRAKLSQPRGLLEMWIGPAGNQQRLFRCVPTTADTKSDADRDIANGPFPKDFDIVQIAGSNLFRVSFTVECQKLECSRLNGGGSPPLALNNRWSISESMDSDFYITRVISGHLRISYGGFADLQATSVFRYEPLVVPSLEDGFQRESISFSVSPNGLEADYTVTDRQVYNAPPWPATNWSGSHTESLSNGLVLTTDLNIHLSGPPSAPTELLVARAIETASLRLGIIPGDKTTWGKQFMIQGASLTTSIGRENSVDGRFRVQWVNYNKNESAMWNLYRPRLVGRKEDAKGKAGALLTYSRLKGQTYEYNPLISPTPEIFGYTPHGDKRDTTALFLLTCALQNPCASDISSHAPGSTQSSGDSTQDANQQTYSTTVTEKEYSQSSSSDSGTTGNYSDSTREAMYTVARMESKYIVTPLTVQMPRAISTDSDSSDEDACVCIELGPPQCQREILYEAERIGEPPQMPEPLKKYEDGNLKGTLLSATMSFCPPALSADGQSKIFRTTARYLYALNRAPKKEETLRTGVLPFTNFTLDGTNSSDTPGTSIELEYAFDSKIGP